MGPAARCVTSGNKRIAKSEENFLGRIGREGSNVPLLEKRDREGPPESNHRSNHIGDGPQRKGIFGQVFEQVCQEVFQEVDQEVDQEVGQKVFEEVFSTCVSTDISNGISGSYSKVLKFLKLYSLFEISNE